MISGIQPCSSQPPEFFKTPSTIYFNHSLKVFPVASNISFGPPVKNQMSNLVCLFDQERYLCNTRLLERAIWRHPALTNGPSLKYLNYILGIWPDVSQAVNVVSACAGGARDPFAHHRKELTEKPTEDKNLRFSVLFFRNRYNHSCPRDSTPPYVRHYAKVDSRGILLKINAVSRSGSFYYLSYLFE